MPASAANRRGRKVAERLHKLDLRAGGLLIRAAAASGRRQAKDYRRARRVLTSVLGVARTANGKSVLGVPLDPIESAVTALLGLLPP